MEKKSSVVQIYLLGIDVRLVLYRRIYVAEQRHMLLSIAIHSHHLHFRAMKLVMMGNPKYVDPALLRQLMDSQRRLCSTTVCRYLSETGQIDNHGSA